MEILEPTEKKYPELYFNIVLVEPEIPNNTGSVGRLCVGSQSRLHLIGPLGFEITDSRVRRAGLDYWPDLEWSMYSNFEQWLQTVENPERIFLFSSKAKKAYHSVPFQKGDWMVFGKESVGLSEDILNRFPKQHLGIPFPGKVRSFNLSNAVAMAIGEGLRQLKPAP